MARTVKNGVPYISLDCNFFDKPKMFEVEERFGEIGMARALRLMLSLYSGEGCWIEWNENSAYYFAKKVLGNAGAANEIEELVQFLISIGFFTLIEGTDTDEFGRSYLTSIEIINDWLKIQKKSKRKTDLNRIPRCILAAANTDISKITKLNITSEEKHITSEVMQQRKEKKSINKQTNKQEADSIPAEIPQASATPESAGSENPIPDTEPTPFRSWPEADAEARGRENWHRARDLAKGSLFFRGISADLIDAAAVCLVHGWIGTGGLRNIQRKARDALDVYGSSGGRRGKANGWETVRDCVSLTIREQGIEPPAYSRKNPEPPPIKP